MLLFYGNIIDCRLLQVQ